MNRLFLSVILITVIFSACTIYREYPIDIYKPRELAVPLTVKNATIVYRNFKYPDDTLQHYFKDNNRMVKVRNDPENLDSIVVFTCLNALMTDLKKNETFEQVRIFPYNSFKRHTSEQLHDIPSELIKKIGSTVKSDWLISLETFSCFFSRYPQNMDSRPTNEVFTVAVWGIYDVEHTTKIERRTMIDTVFWNGYDERGNYRPGMQLPSRLTALKIASAIAGQNYAKRFDASWQTVDRIYSVPPLPDFSNAANYFEEGKYDRAIALWKKYLPERNGKLAINACYNIALAYEMKDELSTAQNWLDAAYKLAISYNSRKDLQLIRSYRMDLDNRILDIKRLE